MQDHIERRRKRLAKLANTLKDQVYSERRPVDQLLVSGATGRISYAEARKLSYRPVKLGEQFGPLWSTFWFRGQANIPSEWAGKTIDLIWVAHFCESTLWLNGQPAQALNYSFGERCEATLSRRAKAGERLEFEVELACNTAYGAWPKEHPYENISPYVLDKCELALLDPTAHRLYCNFLVLQQMEADIAATNDAEEKAWGEELLAELNRFANTYDPDDASTWDSAQEVLSQLYKNRNSSGRVEISAIGEGHLDLAWLWPFAETRRKIIRTTSNQLELLDTYPAYKFACSQACFYDELKAQSPELYKKVKEKIAGGGWIPVGGSWVEPDCNLPSGESLVRQFLYGQRFFEQEFGKRSAECWLQDAFGFNAQLPQLMSLAGMTRFISQKLLWSNPRPTHRLFYWEGLDGSKVLAHFPPRNVFSKDLKIPNVIKAARDYEYSDLSPRILMSYGLGDGGGGPTRTMIEILQRAEDLKGVPRVIMRGPSEFFELVEHDLKKQPPPSWVGELYFPRHRGTYTSQAATKKAMRAAEKSLHNAEFLSAVAFKHGQLPYPQDELERLWKVVLLNQFHDILPGTSIAQVHQEAVAQLNEVVTSCGQLCRKALHIVGAWQCHAPTGATARAAVTSDIDSSPPESAGSRPASEQAARTLPGSADVPSASAKVTPINTISFDRHEVANTPDGKLVTVEAPAYGIGRIINDFAGTVQLSGEAGLITLENRHLLAQFDHGGDLVRLFHKETAREALSSAGNRLQIYDDHTLDYDAWEIEPYHEEMERDCALAESHKVLTSSPLRAEVVFERKIGAHSSMKQTVRLDAGSRRLEFHCEIDWHEDHKLLKVLFPVAVSSDSAAYEMQFGATERPTHRNTPYAQAQFEVPGHKWADLSGQDFGVALLSQCKHGFSTRGNEMRLSLLRAPKDPDPDADMGRHEFAYAVMPHQGRWQDGGVVAEAFKFNHPFAWSKFDGAIVTGKSFARTDDPNLVLDTIKKAEEGNALVLRLYEAHGCSGKAKIYLGFPFKSANLANILEDRLETAGVSGNAVEITYNPCEIITLVVS